MITKDKKITVRKKQAKEVAENIVEHAKEIAKQILIGNKLDIDKIPLICKRVDVVAAQQVEMTKKLDQISNLQVAMADSFTKYIDGDNKWKEGQEKYRAEQVEPIVENRRNLKWLGNTAKTVLGALILIASAVTATLYLLGKFK